MLDDVAFCDKFGDIISIAMFLLIIFCIGLVIFNMVQRSNECRFACADNGFVFVRVITSGVCECADPLEHDLVFVVSRDFVIDGGVVE